MVDLSQHFRAVILAASALGGAAVSAAPAVANVEPTAEVDRNYTLKPLIGMASIRTFTGGAQGAVDEIMKDTEIYLASRNIADMPLLVGGKPMLIPDNAVRAHILGNGIKGECVVTDSPRLKDLFFGKSSATLTCSITDEATHKTTTASQNFDSDKRYRAWANPGYKGISPP